VGCLPGFRLQTYVVHLLGKSLQVLVFAAAVSWVMVLIGVIAREPEHVRLLGFTALFAVTFVSSASMRVVTMLG